MKRFGAAAEPRGANSAHFVAVAFRSTLANAMIANAVAINGSSSRIRELAFCQCPSAACWRINSARIPWPSMDRNCVGN